MSRHVGIIEDEDDPEHIFHLTRIHIRIKQRKGNKHITTIEGLPDDLDLPRILSAMKKRFNCNGNVVKHEMGDVLQLTGDQRDNAEDFLVSEEIANKDNIYIHGY